MNKTEKLRYAANRALIALEDIDHLARPRRDSVGDMRRLIKSIEAIRKFLVSLIVA